MYKIIIEIIYQNYNRRKLPNNESLKSHHPILIYLSFIFMDDEN